MSPYCLVQLHVFNIEVSNIMRMHGTKKVINLLV